MSQPIKRLLLWVWLFSQVACIGTTPPSQFYLLEPLSPSTGEQSAGHSSKLTLALAPIRIPRYLDRVQLVRATGKNTYQLEEFHRWAENLDDNMTRVMLQNLSILLPADVVVQRYEHGVERRLAITILEFHIDPEGQAVLSAQWQLSKGNETVLRQQNSYKLPAPKDDVAAQVQVLNQCLHQLSQDIATALKRQNVG